MNFNRSFSWRSSNVWSTSFLFFVSNEYILTFSEMRVSQSNFRSIRIHWFMNNLTNSSLFQRSGYWFTKSLNFEIAWEIELWMMTSLKRMTSVDEISLLADDVAFTTTYVVMTALSTRLNHDVLCVWDDFRSTYLLISSSSSTWNALKY